MAASLFHSQTPLSRAQRGFVLCEARSWIGTPYLHQGSLKGAGCDCLGLLRGLWRALHGVEPEPMPPYQADWTASGAGETLADAASRWLIARSPGDEEAGDVLLFRWRDDLPVRHAGLYTGHDRLIHAYERAGVVESPLGSPWKRRISHVFSFPEPY